MSLRKKPSKVGKKGVNIGKRSSIEEGHNDSEDEVEGSGTPNISLHEEQLATGSNEAKPTNKKIGHENTEGNEENERGDEIEFLGQESISNVDDDKEVLGPNSDVEENISLEEEEEMEEALEEEIDREGEDNEVTENDDDEDIDSTHSTKPRSIAELERKFLKGISALRKEVANNAKQIKALHGIVSKQQQRIVDLEKKVVLLQHKISSDASLIEQLQVHNESLEGKSRRANMIFKGISEHTYPNPYQAIDTLFQDLGTGLTTADCSNVLRLGKKDDKKTILITFKSGSSKGAVYSNVKKLRNMPNWGGINIGDDLTKTEQDQMRDLRIVAAHAKAIGKKVELKGKTVKIQGKVYV